MVKKFDPSEHPRDGLGQFTKSTSAEAQVRLEPPAYVPPDPAISAPFEIKGDKYAKQLSIKVRECAGMRGVPAAEVHEVFDRVKAEWEAMPARRRPAPPEEWVEGLKGGRWNRTSSQVIADEASAWALYRCQSDRTLFDDTGTEYVSVDLETAMPVGSWSPGNGDIIEMAAIRYDHEGNQTGRYVRLFSPTPEHLSEFGTGAEHIHHISPEMVEGRPHFSEQARLSSDLLAGRVLMAHNSSFELGWLNHHINAAHARFTSLRPTADTYVIAREHFRNRMDNHQLGTVGPYFGVPYTDEAHRAEHDALASGQVFFAMREQIFAEYDARYRKGRR